MVARTRLLGKRFWLWLQPAVVATATTTAMLVVLVVLVVVVVVIAEVEVEIVVVPLPLPLVLRGCGRSTHRGHCRHPRRLGLVNVRPHLRLWRQCLPIEPWLCSAFLGTVTVWDTVLSSASPPRRLRSLLCPLSLARGRLQRGTVARTIPETTTTFRTALARGTTTTTMMTTTVRMDVHLRRHRYSGW